ncbi:MAG: hypothetical protein ACFFDN_32050, partial [Candidatus Hodarchaeota archaeon]
MLQILFTFPIFLIIFLIRSLSFGELVIVFLSYGGRCYFNLYVAYYSTLNIRWKAGIGDLLRECALFFIISFTQIHDLLSFIVLIAVCELFGLLTLIILSLNSLRDIQGDDLISWKVLFESSLKLTTLQILTYSTIYVCMFFLSKNELGIFAYANSFAGIIGIINSIIANTIFPHYATIINFKTWKECVKEISLHTLIIIGMSLLILFGILLIPLLNLIELLLRNIGISKKIFTTILILSIYYLITCIVVPIYRFSLIVGWDKEIIISSFAGIIVQVFSIIIFEKLAIMAGLALIFGISAHLFLLWLLTIVKKKKFSSREHIPL